MNKEELTKKDEMFIASQLMQAAIIANPSAWNSPEQMESVSQYSVIYARTLLRELSKKES